VAATDVAPRDPGGFELGVLASVATGRRLSPSIESPMVFGYGIRRKSVGIHLPHYFVGPTN